RYEQPRRPAPSIRRARGAGKKDAMQTYVIANKHIQFEHEDIKYPRSTEEVVALVAYARATGRKLKAIGGGHGFNHNVKTSDYRVDLRFMNTIEIDKPSQTATFGAGTVLHDAIAALEQVGLAFPSLGSWSSQSVAGVVGTSTHGSSLRWG